MATLDHGSPSQFVGQPWSSWADKVIGPANKDAAESSGQGDQVDGALEVPDDDADKEQDKEQVMKLRIEDASVFGICPTQDEFYLVVCEQCGRVVKPQALERHMELRHGKPPDKPPDVPCQVEIMHSPPIRIPTSALRASQYQHQPHRQSRIPLHQYKDSAEGESELSTLRAAASAQPQPPATFDTVLSKQLPGHVTREESPSSYTTTRSRDSASPVASGKPNSPLEIQETVISNLVIPHLPVVRLERMSPQEAQDASVQSMGVSPVSLASSKPQTTMVELATVPAGPVQCAPSFNQQLQQQQQQQAIITQQAAKPVQTAMVQLAPVPTSAMQTVKPTLVQPPLIQPAPTNLLKLAPALTVQTKKSKKLSPKKNILCKDREFDVNKHCGVWVDADQRQCTRSLTCKTHALSLRRAVKGRRKPFDELLAEHKANNPTLPKKSASQTPPVSSAAASSSTSTNPATTQGNTRPVTPKAVPSRPNTPKATMPKALTPKATTPKMLSPRPQTISSLHNVKAEPGAKQLPMFLKIMPVPGPTRSFNLNSVLPVKTSQPNCTPRGSSPTPEGPSSPTSKPLVAESGASIVSSQIKPGDGGDKNLTEREAPDYSCSHHHPRPVAMCSFGARQVGKGLYSFNRRLDHLRSTMAALVEKHSRPPPLKKMCLSSNSSQECAAPMDTSPPSHAPDLQISNPSSLSAASSSAFSFANVSPFDNAPCGSKTSATTCSSNSSSSSACSRTKSVPNAACNNFSKGLAASKKLGGKTSTKASVKSTDGKVMSSQQHPMKNSKARRKSGSGGGGGKASTSVSGNVASTLFSVSSANPVTLTTGSSNYSIVTNSGLQAVDILSSGMVNLDAASITNPELSGNLLKNLRFVVTNIEPNSGATVNAMSPQTTGNFTVPILNALGNTPVLLGSLGALALPHDGKLNVKSRTKGSGKSTADRQGRRPSGGNATANLQNVALVNQPFIDTASLDNLGGAVSTGDKGTTISCQPLQSPQSIPSPQLRPNSASPQLTSPLPNGIIPSPTGVTFKPYPGTSIAGTTTTIATASTNPSANHVQRGMSPSQMSTPSPAGSGSADASPNITGQMISGSFNTSGNISLVSPKGSSHNLQKSTLNQKHIHQRQPQRTVSHLSNQQVASTPQQQQQQQQQQTLQFHQQLQLQQQISNLVAMDSQGKPVPLNSALIPNLFQTIPAHQVGANMLPPGSLTLAPPMTTDQGAGKVLSQSTVLPQGAAIALQLQQHQQPGANQPIRLQSAGLADQSQLTISQDEDSRQELKMQH